MSGYRPEGLHDTFVPEHDADATEPVLPAHDGAAQSVDAEASAPSLAHLAEPADAGAGRLAALGVAPA